MRFLLSFLIIAIITFLVGMVAPWWSVALVAAVVAAIAGVNGWQGFFSAFLAVFVVWLGYAFVQDVANDSILSTRMGALIGDIGTIGILILSAIIGALAAGFGGMTGALGRQMVAKAN